MANPTLPTLDDIAAIKGGYVNEHEDEYHGTFTRADMPVSRDTWTALLTAAELGVRLSAMRDTPVQNTAASSGFLYNIDRVWSLEDAIEQVRREMDTARGRR